MRSGARPSQTRTNYFIHCSSAARTTRTLARLIDVFWLAFYKASDFVNLDNVDPVATWRDHAAIVDAVEAKDVEEAQRRLDRHYEGISRVIAANKTSSNVGGVQ